MRDDCQTPGDTSWLQQTPGLLQENQQIMQQSSMPLESLEKKLSHIEWVLLMFFFNLPPELSLNAADCQGDHTGHCLYLVLSNRKLSGEKKFDHTQLDQQTVATPVDLKRGEEVFLQYTCFHTKAYFAI